MGTSRRKLRVILIFLTSILTYGSLRGLLILAYTDTQSSGAPQILIDKVFTFSAPEDSLQFEDLAFVEEFAYYLTIEIVTPHNCAINITIIDPDAYRYRVFETEVNVSQDDGWFEIPFGTAITGNYSIIMEVITSLTLNIYVQLIREHKCLYDVIPPNLLGTMKFYEVSRFVNGTEITHNFQLRTDFSYKFYIARVSSIGGLEGYREVEVFYNLTDPNGILFQIYRNTTLVPIGDVLSFDFGTAISGVYAFELIIRCRVDCVNIAYAIAEDYQISDQINGTAPTPDPSNNSTNSKGFVILSSQFTIGMIAVCVSLAGGTYIYVVVKKRRESRQINS
jgi:hypothetical protein